MPRRARLDAPGTLHHVIVRGIEKRRIFDDDPDREKFVERLGDLSQRSQTAICAYSLMTNHAHFFRRLYQVIRPGTRSPPTATTTWSRKRAALLIVRQYYQIN